MRTINTPSRYTSTRFVVAPLQDRSAARCPRIKRPCAVNVIWAGVGVGVTVGVTVAVAVGVGVGVGLAAGNWNLPTRVNQLALLVAG
ncbi:MAG: hypothetical protein DMF07_09270 [Verrucomicrobia bacterium]|nr:MAG: hypothetical protein DMF07_09270 [Verrucomicrobiota bacterium]